MLISQISIIHLPLEHWRFSREQGCEMQQTEKNTPLNHSKSQTLHPGAILSLKLLNNDHDGIDFNG